MDEQEIRKSAALEDRHWWYVERRRMVRRSVRDLVPGRALDVGCGPAGNTRELRSLGWTTVGVETNAVACRIAADRGISVVQGDGRRLPFEDESFDLVLSTDVWEHVEEDEVVAREAYRVLRPGGRLLVAVPSGTKLWSGHDVALGHVRRYERDSLRDLVVGAGFVVDDLSSWNVLLRPVARARRRHNESESEMGAVSPVLNWGLRTTLRTERYLPVRRLPGISLVVKANPAGMSDQGHWVADPRVAWTPTISARRPESLDAATLQRRLDVVNARLRPGSAAVPVVRGEQLDELLNATSRGGAPGPVVGGLGAEHIVVSVDHAVSDGLGLLAALSELTGVPLSSNARGVSGRPAQHGFVGARARRLAEVVWSPPAVVRHTSDEPAPGDVFASRSITGTYGTAALAVAAAGACADQLVPRRQRNRVRVAVGLSTVGGETPRLRDDSALLRLMPTSTASVESAREALRTQGLEPAPGDATYHRRPWLARITVLAEGALAARLGSTVLVSHLGTVTDDLRDVAFYPVTGGGSGLAVGAVVQGDRTMLTARARGAQHDADGLGRILDLVADRIS